MAKRDEGKKFRIKSMLANSKPKWKSLGIGINDNTYYFGTKIYEDGKGYDAIVTDDRQIYVNWVKVKNEIKKDFNLNYRFSFYDDCVDFLWSNESINKWLYDKCPKIILSEVFRDILEKNKQCIYHVDKRIHTYIATDIIKTYFSPIFEALGRTFLNADRGSGKTKQLTLYKLMSFNPIMSPNISGASFYRIIESTAGTLLIDDFDAVIDEQKTSIIQSIRTGYKKGQKAIRSDKRGNANVPTGFNLFSHSVIDNVLGLDEITQDRCNRINMLKTNNTSIANIKLNENDKYWQEIRDNLHICALQSWQDVLKVYEELEVKELKGRELEKVFANLVIAKLCGENYYKELLSFFVYSSEQGQIKEISNDWEFNVFDYLHKNVQENRWVRVKDIVDGNASFLFNTESHSYKKDVMGFSQWVGKLMSKNPLFKRRVYQGYPQYLVKVKDLCRYIKLKGFDKYIENFSMYNVSTNSTSTTNTTPSTNSTHPTKIVEEVVED